VKLIASLIVRNELSRFLEPCIAHLLDFCDEVRVMDDHSDDDTWPWLLRRDRRVIPMRVGDDSGFFRHEGQTRNQLLQWTLQGEPTHVLAVDADEFVSDGAAVRRACETGADVMSLEMLEVWKAFDECLGVRGDGGWRPHQVHALWKVTDRSRVWPIADRALACGRVPTLIDQTRAAPTGAQIFHFGWANEAERAGRHHRYEVADGGRFHQSQHLQSIMWPDDRVALHGFDWPDGIVAYRDAILHHATRGEAA
jgi:glycosyltransferase involved in cell wall biosynthesis